MFIRLEKLGDEQALHRLTTMAFEPMSFSDGSEPEALDTLRRDGDLVLSLVALKGDEIVGHIAFSPAMIGAEKKGWIGIGPVSVLPKYQRTGIGSALMNEGLSRMKNEGAKGCVLTGNPAYYGRFGFNSASAVTFQDMPTKSVLWLAFEGNPPKGEVPFSAGLQEC